MVDVSDNSDKLATLKVAVVCTQIENLMYVTIYILCEVTYYKKYPCSWFVTESKLFTSPAPVDKLFWIIVDNKGRMFILLPYNQYHYRFHWLLLSTLCWLQESIF